MIKGAEKQQPYPLGHGGRRGLTCTGHKIIKPFSCSTVEHEIYPAHKNQISQNQLELSEDLSMKGCNSVANLQKMTLYNLNIDFVKDNVCINGGNYVVNLRKTKIYNTIVYLVNDNVYTKFCLILSIRSQDND